jgi:hypothetical protein
MRAAVTIRIWAGAAVVLLGLYYVLRVAAGGCSGAACDVYVLPSLGIPLLALVAVGATTLLALRASVRRRPWFVLIAVAGAMGTAGPLVALGILRDEPDLLVPIATGLLVLPPIAALAYSVSVRPGQQR